MRAAYHVKKIDKPIDWVVEVPGSKSMTNRALLMAALTEGKVELNGVLFSDDSRHFLDCLVSLGFSVETDEQAHKVTVVGCGGCIPKKVTEINVGSAGTAARFLTAMLGFTEGEYTIFASEQMKKRPMAELFELLKKGGAEITFLEQPNHLPVRIRGIQPTKPLELELDISKSTQFLSAILLISPMIKQGVKIQITSEKKDGSYIRITRKMLEDAGVNVKFDESTYVVDAGAAYQKKKYQIEPDVSAACYFYGAAAITGGRALVKQVHSDNSQGDMKFLSVLEQMGCQRKEKPEGIEIIGPKNGKIKGLTVNMNDFSDQALTLAAMAPYADEPVCIKGIGHIRLQECDRLSAMAKELSNLGILCAEEKSSITIYPGMPKKGSVKTYEDHRVAMAFSLIGLRSEGITIQNPDCCKKTFETYFDLLDRLTGHTKTY